MPKCGAKYFKICSLWRKSLSKVYCWNQGGLFKRKFDKHESPALDTDSRKVTLRVWLPIKTSTSENANSLNGF